MPILFECDCGQKYSVKDEFAGKKTICRICGELIPIPALAPQPGQTKARSPKTVAPEVHEAVWDEDVYEDDDYEVETKPRKARSQKPLDLPVKKSQNKSKKSARGTSPGMPMWAVVTMMVGAAAVAMSGVGFIVWKTKSTSAAQALADPGAAAAVVPKLVQVRNDLGNFAIDFPEGWEARTGGGSGGMPPFASTSSGGVYLSVKSDQHSTALFTNMQTMVTEKMPLEYYPVHKAHELVRVKLEAEYDAYEETPAKLITTKYGDGRISEFTAKEGFFSKTKGLRATFLSNAWCLKITCKCPESEFAENEALFRAVISSFSN